MRAGKKKYEFYLDVNNDANLIELLKAGGITKTIKRALVLYELGLRMYPDNLKEDDIIETDG